MTLGLGQSANDQSLSARVTSISGSLASPAASIVVSSGTSFAGKTYVGRVGDDLPKVGGGFDPNAPLYTATVNITVLDMSPSAKTVTLRFHTVEKTQQ